MKKTSYLITTILLVLLLSQTAGAQTCDCGTCDWYGTNIPMCCESCSGWGWYDGGCQRSCVCPSSCEGGCVGSQCGSTTTTAATTSTTTTSATTSTTTTAATTSTTTAGATTTTTAATTTTTAAGGLDCTGALVWIATAHYENAGTQVYYNGNLYENNWYSEGENPEENSGTGQVWTLIGACDPGLLPTTTTVFPPVDWDGTDGYATRYWDCCKPHCSWTDNVPAGMEPLRTCLEDGVTLNPDDPDAVSACEGGTSYACYKFIPFVVAADLSYGFAATGSGDVCGKCFEMQFTGHGYYDDTPGVVAIQGKRMIVMATNIGYDVGGGQFDLMIPGGGVGMFDACTNQWGIPNDQMGAVYGGLLSACNQEVGYYDHEAIKDCLRDKNDALFRSRGLTEMAEGLDWFIDWFEAADNPALIYREVSCPQELIDISGLVRPTATTSTTTTAASTSTTTTAATTSTTTTAATTSTTTTAATTSTTTTAASTSTTTTAATTTTTAGAGCTCDSGCDGTSRSVPFTQNGSGTYCWQVSDSINYINSWSMSKLEINGVDYTNIWSNSFPARIDGVYYIYYEGSVPWSHFEAN